MDAIDVSDAARLVRELRGAGLAEWTISGICRAANRVFKFARRHCSWRGDNPFAELETSERPKVSATPERRIYVGGELAQVLAAATEPWRTLFRLASVVGGRESELLGLWWEDVELGDLDRATIRFGFRVGRDGKRVPLKTEESKATLPLPRSTALMLLEHKARTPAPTSPRSYIFATRIGRPINQRNVLRALYRAQERARTPEGLPTFPELFEVDARGHLAVDADGQFVPRNGKRRELRLPDFHALRHGAAMDCDDAEEARDLLRHKNSNVTRAIYRAHFGDRRRELLRARMETRMEASGDVKAPREPDEGTQRRGIEGAA
jgi:integrase